MILGWFLSIFILIGRMASQKTEQFDPFQSLLSEAAAKVRLVQKLVNVDFYIKIDNPNSWYQFPDMNIYWTQDQAQFVNFDYQITVYTNRVAYVVTRLIVDDKENPFFRVITGNEYYYHTNQKTRKMWLPRGQHNAKIQYKATSPVTVFDKGSDCQANYFLVEYYKIKTKAKV